MNNNKLKKKINKKRIGEIKNYLLSINNLCNPSMIGILRVNPIGGSMALQKIVELREELLNIEIDINDINLEAIYGDEELSELDEFISDHENSNYLLHRKDYKNILENEALELIFPRAERIKTIDELESAVEKDRRMIEAFEGDKNIFTSRQKRIDESCKEIEAIKLTLSGMDRETLTSLLYGSVSAKLNNLIFQCDTKIDYLEGVQSEW